MLCIGYGAGESAMTRIRDRYRQEFEKLGEYDVRERVKGHAWDGEKLLHAQEWLRELDTAAEREAARLQMAIAHEANEIARSASVAARDAATAARSQGRVAKAAVIIAIAALAVSIITPERIKESFSSIPWASWLSK